MRDVLGVLGIVSGPDQYGLLIGVATGLLVAVVVIWRLTRRGRRAHLEVCEVALRQSNLALADVRASLEAQVDARTAELRHRSELLQAVATLGRDVSGIQDAGALIGAAAPMIADRFHVHHAGIYLLEGAGPSLVLCGASSEEGQSLLSSSERARAAVDGLAASVIFRQEPLTANNGRPGPEAHDPHWLDGTRSEIAVPLRYHDRVMGVLDLQSQEPGAFSREDIEALEIAAQQLVLAIYALGGPPAVERATIPDKMAGGATEAVAVPGVEITAGGQLLVPVLLYGQAIGMIALERDTVEQPWSAEERDLARVIGIQAGAALERARLFEAFEMSTRREHLLHDLAWRLRGAEDADRLVQIALGEIGRALDLAVIECYIEGVGLFTAQSYRATDGAVQPWPGPVSALAREARERGEVVIDREAAAGSAAVPLRSEGQVIGAMRIERRAGMGPWPDEEIALLNALADMLLGALEGVRYREAAGQRLSQERAAAEVPQRLHASLDVDTVLRTAVDELQALLGLDAVTVRVGPALTPGVEEDQSSYLLQPEGQRGYEDG